MERIIEFKTLQELNKFEKSNRQFVITNIDYITVTGLWSVTFSTL